MHARRGLVQITRASEQIDAVQLFQWGRIAYPLDQLVLGDKVNILVLGQQIVQNAHEPSSMVFTVEPRRMVVQAKRGSIRFVVTLKVLHDHLVHALLVRWIRAGVAHRATATAKILPHDQADFPETYGYSRREKVTSKLTVQRTKSLPGYDFVGQGAIMHS